MIIKTIFGSIKWQLLVICLILVSVPIVVLGLLTYNTFRDEMYHNTEKELIAIAKDWYILAEAYSLMEDRILKREEYLVGKRLESIALDVKGMMTLVDDLYGPDVPASAMNELLEQISDIKIGRSGFVFILDESGNYVLSENGEHDGDNFFVTLDPECTSYLEDVLDEVDKLQADDMYSFHCAWGDSNQLDQKMKYTVLLKFQPWNFIIGVASYYTDYKSKDLEERLQNELKYLMADRRIGKLGYIWAINSQGEYIVSKNMYRNGENILEVRDANGEPFIRHIIEETKALPAGEVYMRHYPWKNIGDAEALDKISACVYVPEWDWIIGAGSYESEFLEGLSRVRQDILRTCLVALILGAIVTYLFASFISGPIIHLDQNCMMAAGGKLDVAISDSLLQRKDEVGRLANSFDNMITNLKEMFDRLDESKSNVQTMLDSMPIGIMVVTQDGLIRRINETMLSLARYDHADELVGQTSSHMLSLPEEEVSSSEDRVKIGTVEYVLHAKDTTAIPVLKSTVPIQIGGENLFLESLLDITERKNAEIEQRRLEQELNRSQKLESIGTLAAGVAHEINTPIQFIGDNTRFVTDAFSQFMQVIKQYQMIRMDYEHGQDVAGGMKGIVELEEDADIDFLQQEIPQALKQTQEGVERVARIVGAMKNFAHMGDEKKMASINDAIEPTLTISRNEWKYVADVKTELMPELPPVNCFIHDVKQVLLNLIVNASHTIGDALKTRGEEKGLITVRTYEDDGYVIIAVSDTGMGIPEDKQERVFDPFFTTKTVGKGTGQGLSMAYQLIVEKHQGRLWFDSEVGKGTTFYIALPM